MATRIYVSGGMSGIKDHNFPAFKEATTRLRAAGYHVVSPAELNPESSMTWRQYLVNDLNLLTVHCDGIALLKGWEKSRGARLELAVALQLGMYVMDAETMQPLEIENTLVFTGLDGKDLHLDIKDSHVQETHTICQDSPLMQT